MTGKGTKTNPAVVSVRTMDAALNVMQQCRKKGRHAIVAIESDEMLNEMLDDLEWAFPHPEPVHVEKIGRNQPCPCGSGEKYKKCCGASRS